VVGGRPAHWRAPTDKHPSQPRRCSTHLSRGRARFAVAGVPGRRRVRQHASARIGRVTPNRGQGGERPFSQKAPIGKRRAPDGSGSESDFQANDNRSRNPTFSIPAQALVGRSDLNVSTSRRLRLLPIERQLLCRSRVRFLPRGRSFTTGRRSGKSLEQTAAGGRYRPDPGTMRSAWRDPSPPARDPSGSTLRITNDQ